jgi:putative membrane protein
MDYYSWLKAAHVFVVFVFVGGMILNGFLLLNLQPGSTETSRIAAAAKRWNGPVTGIALTFVWIFGLTLAYMGNWFADTWLSIKMLLVLILSALHGMQSGAFRRMLASPSRPPAGYLRYSAAVTLIFIAIIAVLVIVKPF